MHSNAHAGYETSTLSPRVFFGLQILDMVTKSYADPVSLTACKTWQAYPFASKTLTRQSTIFT